MGSGGEISKVSREVPLETDEVIEFQKNIVWPAMSFFWLRGNFLTESSPGTSFNFDSEDLNAEYPWKVYIAASCRPSGDIDSSLSNSENICFATITIERMCADPDITEGLKSIAVESNEVSFEALDDYGPDEINAWETKTFYFSTDPGNLITVETEYGLRDNADEFAWAPTSVEVPEFEVVDLSAEEQGDVEAIADKLGINFSDSDRIEVLAALSMLGLEASSFDLINQMVVLKRE